MHSQQKLLKIILKEQLKNFLQVIIIFILVKESPAYWKQYLYNVPAMVKQLGIPTYLLALSCADLRWENFHILLRN